MALTVQTQISGDVFILGCNGRIISRDECAVLRERVVNMLPGTPKIVVNLEGVDHIDSEGLGMLVGLLVSARNRTNCPEVGKSRFVRRRWRERSRRSFLLHVGYANRTPGHRLPPRSPISFRQLRTFESQVVSRSAKLKKLVRQIFG